jgi:hypothetical protein
MHPWCVSLMALSALHASGPGSAPGDSAGFVTVLGRDTIALESFSRTATRLQGDIVLRVPGTVQFHYAIDLNPDGTVSRSEVELLPLAVPALGRRQVVLEFVNDSVRVAIDSAGTKQRATYAVRSGAAPLLTTGFDNSYGLYVSFGLYELLFTRPSFRLTDSATVPAIGALSGRVGTTRFARRAAGQVDADWLGYAWNHLTVDDGGRILGADASATTEKTRTYRTGPIDVARAAKGFAARDRAGRGVGIASPRDSVRTMLGPAHIAVDYSSPRRRERTILGPVVPYNQVWRTGANAATSLFVDRPLTIGDAVLPAGGYTLWTLPTESGVLLIINRQYGQWGTDYDASRDLARVPLQVSVESTPRENFSIVVTGQGNTGELRIQWDTFVWRVALKVN